MAALLNDLAAMPARLAALVTRADAEDLDRRPAGGGWSLRQIAAHMADLEFNLRWPARVARILHEEEPDLIPVEPDVRAIEHAYRHQNARAALGVYTIARKHLVGELARLDADAWQRRAGGPGGVTRTLWAEVCAIAEEDRAHLERAEGSPAAAGGPLQSESPQGRGSAG